MRPAGCRVFPSPRPTRGGSSYGHQNLSATQFLMCLSPKRSFRRSVLRILPEVFFGNINTTNVSFDLVLIDPKSIPEIRSGNRPLTASSAFQIENCNQRFKIAKAGSVLRNGIRKICRGLEATCRASTAWSKGSWLHRNGTLSFEDFQDVVAESALAVHILSEVASFHISLASVE